MTEKPKETSNEIPLKKEDYNCADQCMEDIENHDRLIAALILTMGRLEGERNRQNRGFWEQLTKEYNLDEETKYIYNKKTHTIEEV